MSRVRIGAVEYLNARPLVFGLEREPRFDVRYDLPAHCAALLHEGATDVGLIPSIEYLRPPAGVESYRIVPGIAIASRGPVASVALYTTRPMADVRSIALDTSSRTSAALTRVLCARVFAIAPAFAPHGPGLARMLERCDAALMIGDKALLLASGTLEIGGVRRDVEKIDLGEVWTAATGLPFVYALWVGRPGALTPDDVRILRDVRDAGVRQPDVVVREYFCGDPALQPIGARYLRENIKYYLDEDERAGLDLFYRYAAETGVVAEASALRFYQS